MELIPEWAPSVHPMLVHFPLAILAVAILFDFISFFLPKEQKWWTEEATAFLYGIGAVAAVGVYFTGKAAANSVFLPAEAQTVLNTHADWAWWTVWFYGIYALARILATWKVPAKHHRKLHLGFFALSFIGLFLLFQTGDNGAKMVFKHGVGVQAAQVEDTEQTDFDESSQNETVPTAFNVNENGDWIWEIENGAVQALQNNFHFISGSAGQLNAEAVQTDSGSYALRLSGDNLNGFFVTHENYQNVQVDYRLDVSAFNGTITLVNHVQDSANYDYVSVSSDGTVQQGRMIEGQPEVFAEGQTDVSKPLFVRVVGSGTHFRGYVDKQMVVHGHGDAPEAGQVGLKLEGNGTVLLEQMELVQLTDE
ncbi:MAG TPA: DUF2231 domain-containing protein [Balneolaceae bacterium]